MTKTRIKSLIAASLVGFASLATPAIASATPAGQIQEDDPGWDCTTMGDHSCGPTNAQGVQAGCYDDGGVLVAAWPCFVVVGPDGDADVYTPDAR